MEYDMIAKLFSFPPSPTFPGKFFRCPFLYPKVPLEAVPPPPTFDAPVHEKTFAVRASTVSYRPKLHTRLRLVSLYLIKHCCSCFK